MDTRVLKYFLAVVREENITKAAEILHITQPTLSRQLAKLEEDLGAQLFVRNKKGIVLTDEGMLFRRRAAEIVELADKAEREIYQRGSFVEGEISIGCGELLAMKLLPKIITTFREMYPGVTFEIYTGNADNIKYRLDNGLTDLGLLLEPVEIEKYDFIRLDVKENWMVLMRSDDPLATKESIKLEEIADKPLIFSKRQSVRNEIESWFRGITDKLNVPVFSNLSTNSALMVEQGVGYCILIEGSLPFLDTSKLVLKPIYPNRYTTSVLAWKKHQPFNTAVSKFLEHIQCYLSIDSYEI